MTDDTAAAIEVALGYAFRDRSLVSQAFTHSSIGADHNETLACLGDRIYGVWVARTLFRESPGVSKGRLTSWINDLCSGRTQAEVFDGLYITEHLVVGGAISGAGRWITENMRATVLEAIVAAIELDGGPDAAVAFLERHVRWRVTMVL